MSFACAVKLYGSPEKEAANLVTEVGEWAK